MDINFKVQQQPDTIYINESGLYSLLLSSRTKKAKKFVKWIKNDVLPLIRKNNIYSTDTEITKLQEKINKKFIKKLNETGKIYISHTMIRDVYSIRMPIGNSYITKKNINKD